MTEGKAFALILATCMVLACIAILGLAALGVEGSGLSLGAIVPLILAGYAIGRMVMHYGESGRRGP
jgi:hypothetical protein